ncbi:MAG: bifunctional (p)ppGpp synthetase/guanosine-3',5'-bis(diphosphate) 3'-pyrophosphohydrolase [Gemmatimonadota bacterium]|nr:bifunctional (p)ppGpp synthetase/guanosine-3',5'-bis(diphosphate) 3'-pyrophosphohydrolase [Gemmatimonadota bacterium]
MPQVQTPDPTPRTIRGLPRPLARTLEAYADRLDVDMIVRAYELAAEAHQGQKRASGEDYVNHSVEVATLLAELKLDTASLAAALIHDVVEDTAVSLEDIRATFGQDVATIVDGVTKIGKVRYQTQTEAQVENYRKLLLSMAQDARVILVKLADRLHNMRTLEHLPPEKRLRVARETRQIYAPLAGRLGVARIRWELEDLAFKFLEPEAFTDLSRKIQQTRRQREREIAEMKRPLDEALRRQGIVAEVTGRPKHLWSIYRKMRKRGTSFEDIYDLMAMRVMTDSLQNCYAALGIIHSLWTPIPERFHDYVATPKSNMYRSIHTTVVGPAGRRYEIQIRTEEMHRTAEYGIAAHWRYKEGRAGESEVDEALTWFRQVLEWQQDTKEPEEFMEFLRMDLFQGEIFVFTPKGEVKPLPTGSTPIDFAFAVHTEVGTHCAGAKVNGRIAPLSRPLRSGDTIEIITNPRQRPNRDWFAFAKTARARQKIRQWIRKEEQESAVRLGKDLLEREIRRARLERASDAKLAAASTELGHGDVEGLHAALGRGDVGPGAVIRQLYPEHDPQAEPPPPTALQKIADRLKGVDRGVRIAGVDNVMVRYAQCCQPVPGDPVMGYVTRGRGVSIHRRDCPNVLGMSDDADRRVPIEWRSVKDDRFQVKLYLQGSDRRGLLSDIATAIADTGTNIQNAQIRGVAHGMIGEFVVEVQDLPHLTKVMNAVRRVKGVLSVERREHIQESDLVEP